MGRELRRVPLDFDWPLKKVWKGYLNPHHKACPNDNVGCWFGSTGAGKWLDAVSRFLALLGEQAADEPRSEQLRARGQTFPHPYLENFAQAPRFDIPHDILSAARSEEDRGGRPASQSIWAYAQTYPLKLVPFTPALADFVSGLSGVRPEGGMGAGDSSWKIRKKLLEVAGMPEDFGTCPVCKGEALDPTVREAYEAWKAEEPPTGEGYQLWETTSEGSPASPVFATLEVLCAWCEDGATVFGRSKATKEEWLRMLKADFVALVQEGVDPDTGNPVSMVFL